MEDAATSLATLRASDGGSVTVFKDSLSACSHYFDALFNGPLSMARQGEFLIPGVTRADLASIARYAHTRVADIDADNVESLIVASDQLLVDGLLRECCKFVGDHLDAPNCVSVLEMTRFFGLEELYNQAHRFLLDNFERVHAAGLDFHRLSIASMVSLLCCDELKVSKEELVWEASVSWIEADVTERKQYLVDLLPHIRFCLMKKSYVKRKVLRNPLVTKDALCKSIVQRYSKIQNFDKDACILSPIFNLFTQRVPAEIMFVYGGIHRGYKSNTWEIYDHKTNEWSTVRTDFRQDLVFGLQCVSVDHTIYVMGADIANLSPFCYCFDAVKMRWSAIKPMGQLRAFFGIAVLDKCVYCIGGSPNGVVTLDTAEQYDTVKESWRFIGRMNHPRLGASAASCNGRVYIVGGMSTQKLIRSTEAYDPETNTWTMVAPMKTERLFHGLVAYRDKIYVIGGLSRKSSVCEVYDPSSGKWSRGSKTKTFTDKVVAVVLDDRIFAIGEANQKDYKRCLEYFTAGDKKWHAIPGYAPPRWFYSACVLKNLPNSIDYISRPKRMEYPFPLRTI
ncbi:kelch-like protein 10 [Ixodes scapularis]|uniref:kelch-like protein 10 n=1 Tax=Ixodes scapularis TaxID=6945 RepID=UPI001A9E883A|nr:kelch-like protein 10 [Ixodes scapularis]